MEQLILLCVDGFVEDHKQSYIPTTLDIHAILKSMHNNDMFCELLFHDIMK